MKIEIIKLAPTDIDDFTALIKVFEDVFEWKNFVLPEYNQLQKLLNNSNFLVFVGKSENKLVGGITAYVLDGYNSDKPSAYIYDLAVKTSYQRKGIGKLIISTLIDFCKKNEFYEIFVQAENEDIQAVNFYKTTPISNQLKAIHFTYSLANTIQNAVNNRGH